MGPAIETFVTILVPLALILSLAIYLSRQRLRRLGESLNEWKKSDEQDEQDRAHAEREVKAWTEPEGGSNEEIEV